MLTCDAVCFGSVCAVVHNDSNVVIYGNTSAKGSAWEVKYTLSNVRGFTGTVGSPCRAAAL